MLAESRLHESPQTADCYPCLLTEVMKIMSVNDQGPRLARIDEVEDQLRGGLVRAEFTFNASSV